MLLMSRAAQKVPVGVCVCACVVKTLCVKSFTMCKMVLDAYRFLRTRLLGGCCSLSSQTD